MPMTLQMNDLADSRRMDDICRGSFDTIFVSRNGKEDMVLMNMSEYRNLFARLQVYRKLDEGEQDIVAGRVSDGFEMLDRVEADVGV